MKRKLIIITTLFVIVGGALFLALSLWPEQTAAHTRTATVRRGELVELASASGTVEPDVQVEVKPRASGEVLEVLVTEGDQVEAGQVLFRLDRADAERDVRSAEVALSRAQAELTQVRASMRVAQAEAAQAQAQADTRNRGAELGLISAEEQRSAATSSEVAQANLTLRQAQIRSSQTQVETARLSVDEANRRLAEMEIRAPVSGTVLSVGVEQGSIVSSGITSVSGGTAMLTIADLSDLRVIGALDEAQVGRVTAGQDVVIRVDAYPTHTFSGRVERVSPLDVATSNVVTFDVEIVVTDEDASLLRSGMSANLDIVTERYEDSLLIPITLIQGQGRRQFVVLESSEQRQVRTGATDGVSMVVLEGLEEGDVVVSGSGTTASADSVNRGAPRQGGTKSLIPMGGPRGGR